LDTQNIPLFTIKEVSEFLGISISTINLLFEEGDLQKKVKIITRRIVL